MSGLGSSLADLDKQVNKSVPGGWVTLGGLALGGAGAAGAFSGLGAGAAGASGAAGGAGGLTAAAVPSVTGGLAVGSGSALAGTGAGAASTLAGGAAGSLGSAGFIAPTIGGTASTGFGLSAGAAPLAGEALTASAAAAVPGSAEAIYNAQTATSLFGGSNPFKISPMQAMAANKMMGGMGQQGGGQQTSTAPFKAGQPVNTADPILALLAPKIKKKERISLL